MKVNDSNQEATGTYISLKLSEKTKDKIMNFIGKNNLQHSIKREDLHSTLIVSKKKLPSEDSEVSWKAYPAKLVKMVTQANTQALVIQYNCDEQLKRHNDIIEHYDTQHNYPDYHMHVTVSYSCNDFDISKAIGFEELDFFEIVNVSYRDACFIWANNPSLRSFKPKDYKDESVNKIRSNLKTENNSTQKEPLKMKFGR